MSLVTLEGWSFIPGPRTIPTPPISSLSLQEIASYMPWAIAEFFLSYPGFRLLHPAEPSWWQWKAAWESATGFISVNMTLFDNPERSWGGSDLKALCQVDDLLELWRKMRERFPAVWLHNTDCEIHTPESFQRWIERENTTGV
jgi:hypothetical protein